MTIKTTRSLGALLSLVATCAWSASGLAGDSSTQDQSQLVVHEWGTFTSLQDDSGRQLARINVDDEPVPDFVYGYKQRLLEPQHATRSAGLTQGAPTRHPDVTLRLETPVMYFYPPKPQAKPMTLDVEVRFLGGWLSQYYPFAQADAPGLSDGTLDFASLGRDTVSSLQWADLQVGTKGEIPATTDPVWTIPREVAAATVTATTAGAEAQSESEKYLFYRGVGHLDSPLSVAVDQRTPALTTATLALRARFQDVLKPDESQTIRWLWLVHIRADGATAYRALDPITVTGDPTKIVAGVRAIFYGNAYSKTNLDRLQVDMHKALTAEGLLDDEATAMLKTWEKSYFASGGLRLFFIVPRVWTDHYLPLSISKPAQITRVMMGRTELISPEQRELLKQLAAAPIGDPSWLAQVRQSPAARRFLEGRSDFGDLGVAIPPDYQMYLDLGRFRNALIVHEQARTHSLSLAKFIYNYELGPLETSAPAAR